MTPEDERTIINAIRTIKTQIVSVRPGDVVLFWVPPTLALNIIENISNTLRQVLPPGVPFLVVPESIVTDIKVVRREDAPKGIDHGS